jgi:hypothetical protein
MVQDFSPAQTMQHETYIQCLDTETHTIVHHICVFLSWSASEWSLRKSLSILVTVRGKSSICRDRDNAGMEMEKENST